MTQGGHTVVPLAGVETDAGFLAELIRAEAVTMTDFVPAVFNALVPELVENESAREKLASLRTVVVGGEQITAETTYRFIECFPGVRVVNLYGPTECSIGSIYHEVHDGDGSRIPIGRPIANTSALLLDRNGRLVARGVPGEIHLGGRCVGEGYLRDAKRTSTVFVPDPYASRGGERLYRTGDLGRYRADGSIECLGRLDEQVKIRGIRIELGEIETVLRRHAPVDECVVAVREDRPGEKRLVAYLVGQVHVQELRPQLRRVLPEYMVPSAFVVLDSLPLTPSGKLDRKALPAPEYAADADRYVAPRTPVEEVLAGIWAEVLRLERVSAEENFFELGGHSLLATQLTSRIRAVFSVELPLRTLFEGPTVAELAGRVEELCRAELAVLPPVVPVERTGALPLSFAQERLWFLDRLEPGSTAYNIPVAWRLGGALDRAALERVLGEIVRRHESLRTVFAERDGAPVQMVMPFGGFVLPVEDLSALGEADLEAAVRRRAGEEARRAFDLTAGPLFRAALLRLGAEDYVLLLSMHHVVSDGWSMGIFFRELSALYAAYREGGESPLPDLAVQYADYAVWQREHLTGEVLERQLAYWKERLGGCRGCWSCPPTIPARRCRRTGARRSRWSLPRSCWSGCRRWDAARARRCT